ncbi:SPFH domain-containing protein [Dyella sp. 2HG41-7]|uniref:SPFH domain-containing protein n=1 Tax=Dyella sp. 2HG41-7 TaxID=2883239 RepID=UPI001EFF3457|nr:SPFH domain-containing protein [Dyella sp. 2HG41-7]
MTVLTLTLLITVLALAAVAVKRVPTGQVYSLYRYGKPVRLLQPGTHVVLPLVDRVGHRIDLGGRLLRFDASLIQATPMQGTVYWQVLEPERADAVIEQADQLIRHSVFDALHADEDNELTERREVAARLKTKLNRQLRDRGVMVTRVELDAA